MWKRIDNASAERARELANTGQFADLLELRLKLREEGYAATDLRSDRLRKELMDTIERKKIRIARARPCRPEGAHGHVRDGRNGTFVSAVR